MVTAKPGVKLENPGKEVWDETDILQKTIPTQAELAAVRVPVETYKASSLQRLLGFGDIAATLTSYDQ